MCVRIPLFHTGVELHDEFVMLDVYKLIKITACLAEIDCTNTYT